MVWNVWEVLFSLTHCPGTCALQVSALQQGAGVLDGAAEEEGTVELGPKRLWKVGHGELCGRDHVFPKVGGWRPRPALVQ